MLIICKKMLKKNYSYKVLVQQVSALYIHDGDPAAKCIIYLDSDGPEKSFCTILVYSISK